MMFRAPFILFFIVATKFCAGSDTTWLNRKWQPVVKSEATYFSISKKKDRGCEQKMYVSHTGRLYMSGSFSDAACNIKSGDFKWFYEDGTLADSITYHNGRQQNVTHFHTNGNVKTIIRYNDLNKATYVNSWKPDGTESLADTFYHDRRGRECNSDTAWLKGIIAREDSAWHLRFYYTQNNRLYINSWYQQRLCTTRIRNFERYNPDGKIIDSAFYYPNGKKQAAWRFYDNCMVSSFKKYDTSGVLVGGAYWDEHGNERSIDPAVVYPSAPGGFKMWKKKVMAQINNDQSIKASLRSTFYGAVQVKLIIDRDGNLSDAYIPKPSAFPDFDNLILSYCKKVNRWKPGTIRGRPMDFVLNCNIFFSGGIVTGTQQSYY